MNILFASPFSALDRANGAAISVTTQLEELAKLGWTCRSVTGMVTSSEVSADRHYAAWGVRRVGQSGQSLLLGTHRHGVEHLIVPMQERRRSRITSGDERRFFDVVRAQLRNHRPDLLYIYGKGLLEQALLREARRQGIATAFYLANASYREPDPFENADAVFTPSRALADFYRVRLDLAPQPIGSFTRPLALPPDRGNAILFVNPEAGKGASFLIEIARRCLSELPEASIVVVESRGTKGSVAAQFDIDWAGLPNVTFMPQQTDLGTALAAAGILLFPALSFDAAPRILVEANHAALPVLSSAHGGAPEMLDGAGFLIDIPQQYRDAPLTLPDHDAVTPWIEQLKLLWHDRTVWELARARATAAAARHDLSRLAGNLSQQLAAVAASAADHRVTLPRSS